MSQPKKFTPDKMATGGSVRTKLSDTAPAGILDAVRDQHGDHWIRYGTSDRALWFSLPDLQLSPQSVFGRLAGPGMVFLATSTKNRFMNLIEAHEDYREALVASHPGWVGGVYVYGNGECEAQSDDDRPVIVGFEPNRKFDACGTLKGWKQGIHPLVRGQTFPMFALAYSFIGPLLQFAPPDLHNPLVEFVGDPGTGKSTLGVMASSVWGGNPGSDVGGGESWKVTLNSLDPIRRTYSDCQLTLDEGNLLGSNPSERGVLLQIAVFALFSTEVKRRYTDNGSTDHLRHATLSTTNLPVRELVAARETIQDAIEQRMVTIIPESKFGVLDSLPRGFTNSRAVIEALRSASDADYGVAGREFVRRLQLWNSHPQNDLPASVRHRMKHYEAHARSQSERSPPRITKTFAITFAAGSLAQKCGLVPGTSWELLDTIRRVHETVATAPKDVENDGLDSIRNYAAANWSEMISFDDLAEAIPEREFEATPGFWRQTDGETELLIPSSRLQAAFPEYRAMMQSLRDSGHARTEGGKFPKLTTKSPRWLCPTGRVYCIRLPDSPGQLRALGDQKD
ncbi:DUF927 domain-containing protein [Devosia submarina]|uniref:DUF927 domain-containing protein n=1 Tax=Devosia submarina TaxID=1173082 RepID=UPI0013005B87|nr:DUF927 domain-containing protein [Devosia submarina]